MSDVRLWRAPPPSCVAGRGEPRTRHRKFTTSVVSQTEMRPSDNSAGLMHRRFPADFIETSSYRAPTGARCGRFRRPPTHRGAPAADSPAEPLPHCSMFPAYLLPDSAFRATMRHAGNPASAGSVGPRKEAEMRPSRLPARVHEGLAKIVHDSRGIGSCPAPRPWVAVIEESETDSAQERRRWCSADKDNRKKYPAELND